jgi:predicted HTH transcriptional regulator
MMAERSSKYLSALANGTCLLGKPRGYLVFGVEDGSHKVVGTRFDPYREKAKGNQDLLIWLANGLQPNVGFEVHQLAHRAREIVIFEVGIVWVILQNAPLKLYRNAFLSAAMVNLNMIDTQGGGIKRMFEKQKLRFFPMPDVLTAEQRRTKIHNLLNDLAQSKRIENRGSKGFPTWFLVVQAEKKQ